MTNTISASEFLAFQSTSMAHHLPKHSGELKATSVRLPKTLDSEVEAIVMLTGFSKNQVFALLVQSGLEAYIADIHGEPTHEDFLKIIDEINKRGEYK